VKNYETPAVLARIFLMEYRGVDFHVVKAIERQKWRWTVAGPDLGDRIGLSGTKEAAAADARRAITWLLAARRRRTKCCLRAEMT
jgi:hypothetical protein